VIRPGSERVRPRASVAAVTEQRGDVLVLFGITGDLARKMILPALYRLAERGELTVPVIGVALTDWDDDRLREHVGDCVRAAFGAEDGGVDDAVLARLQKSTYLVAGNYSDASTFSRLVEVISASASDTAFVVHYLAVPPSLFGTVADGLAAVGLQSRSRLVVEKPFGHDLDSACALDALLRRNYAEEQIFRVDHFLGKEPVEDLLILRFANTLLEPIWNRHWIDRFEITMAEDFDVADRGSFYDSVGTIRDVVQNHLAQVIAYLLMDAPLSDGADDQRDAKRRVLRAIRTVDPAESVRGQYDGYLETAGVAPGSTTETFVALTLHVDGWRWAGVPVHVRAGKALAATLLDVVAVLRPVPFGLFASTEGRPPSPNRIRLRLQPDAGATFTLLAKRPGADDVPVEVPVSVDFRQVLGPTHAPYERIFADALAGNPTHFARMDNIEQAWRIVTPILDLKTTPDAYARGSWGPESAATMPGPSGWAPLPGAGGSNDS
jgi:glucose-6-phosphate 1-dehydrogenase